MTTTSQLLDQCRARWSRSQLAETLQVSSRTLARWEAGEIEPPRYLAPALRELLGLTGRDDAPASFRFIDLFAGIGGIRSGFEMHGGDCVFSSEWNDFSKRTYLTNFPDDAIDGHEFRGDITAVDESEIPDHDVLLAGFPCQPFSIAGVSKKNALGRAHGFADATQGTLFFDIARILAEKRPAAFLLENVKNLRSHDKGRTFAIIEKVLTEELGYTLHTKVLDGIHFVPQHRERIIMVGFREPTTFTWNDLTIPDAGPTIDQVLHRTDGTEPILEHDRGRYFDHFENKVPDKYTLTPRLWEYLQAYAAKHRAAGNGFGFGLVHRGETTRTLSARYYKDGSEILIAQDSGTPRRLTPRECARLMGYDDAFQIPVSDTQAYRQFGNSVVVPLIAEVARIMVPHVREIVRTGISAA